MGISVGVVADLCVLLTLQFNESDVKPQ